MKTLLNRCLLLGLMSCLFHNIHSDSQAASIARERWRMPLFTDDSIDDHIDDISIFIAVPVIGNFENEHVIPVDAEESILTE